MRQRKVLAGAARAQHPPSAGGPIVRIRGGATAPEEVPLNGGAERLLNAFREWLLHPGHGRVRGISEKTSKLYLPVARRYVAWYIYPRAWGNVCLIPRLRARLDFPFEFYAHTPEDVPWSLRVTDYRRESQ